MKFYFIGMKSITYIRMNKTRIFKNIISKIFDSTKMDNFKYRNVRFFFSTFLSSTIKSTPEIIYLSCFTVIEEVKRYMIILIEKMSYVKN